VTVRNLDKLFAPRSVAVVGATDRPGSVGTVVLRNVLSCGFKGEIYPVNPNRKSVSGLKCYPSAESLPAIPELAIICLPPGAVAGSISDFAKRGTKAAIVLTAGLDRALTADGQKVTKAILEAARPQLMRILGPNCIGLLVPGVGLNAGFAHVPAMSGRIAFVSQSGALCTIVLDWAKAHGIGFSHFVSLGESLDVDMGDVIDYLASDPGTDAILLYVESLKQARKFMSASRAASRNKPVIAIKVGRSALGAKAATTHTGALAGNDAAFSAAFDRAGIVRVDSVEELFETVEVLAKAKRVKGERLAIVTNGGGPGVIAVDELVKRGGQLADLSKATTDALDKVLPPTWSKANPIDIIGDGGPARFAAALRLALAEPNADAVLALYSPTAVAPPGDVAEATIEAARGTDKPVLCGWLGGETVAQARTAIGRAGIAQYETPEAGIRAFCRLVEFHRKQKTLLEVPASSEADVTPPLAEVRRLISDVLESKREIMTAPETRRILSAYRIPTASCLVASNVEEAASAADSLGYPVALKILSPEITHKSDVGGVVLNLADREAVRGAATAMLERVAASRPAARLTGFTVEPMVQRMHAYELLVGVSNDPIFGPVIVFG
jgi:acetyltransferase